MSSTAPEQVAVVESRHATHQGFSDESSWNQNRYRSIALVTAPTDIAIATRAKCALLLEESGVGEFAWKNLRDARHGFAAQKLIDSVVELTGAEQLRVDVLVWDTHDTRHQIYGRDDTENLARMYYHIHSNVRELRCPIEAKWFFHIDERSDLDRVTLEDCLAGRTRRERESLQLVLNGDNPERFPPSIEWADSSKEPLIQVADLFAGMGAFSWNEALTHSQWKANQSGQMSFMEEFAGPPVSNSASPKHETLKHFESLGLPYVSIGAGGKNGLRTSGPDNPINFWKYDPQGGFDKAPVRNEL